MSFTVEMILKLVDQISTPAAAAKKALEGIGAASEQAAKAPDISRWRSFGAEFSAIHQRMLAEIPRFTEAGHSIGSGFRAIGDGVRSAASQTRFLIGGLTRIAALAGLSGAGILAMGKSYADTVDEQAKWARQVGLSLQAVRELQFVAGRQGVGAESFAASVEVMTRNLGQLREGFGSLSSYLKRANPALANALSAASPEEAFGLLVEALSAIEDPAERAALATAAFGRSGADMTRIAELGAAGLAAMREEARRFAGVLRDDAGGAAESFSDSLGDVMTALGSLRDAIAQDLLPVLTPLLQALSAWIAANRDIVAANVAGAVQAIADALGATDWQAVGGAIKAVGESLASLARLVGGWGNLAVAFAGMFYAPTLFAFGKGLTLVAVGLGQLIGLVAAAVAPSVLPMLSTLAGGLGAALMSPAAAIAGLIAGVGLLLWNWRALKDWIAESWASLPEAISAPLEAAWNALAAFTPIDELVAALDTAITFLGDLLRAVPAAITADFGPLVEVVSRPFTAARDAAIQFCDLVVARLTAVVEAIKEAWGGLVGWFEDLFKQLASIVTFDWLQPPEWLAKALGLAPAAAAPGPVAAVDAPVVDTAPKTVDELLAGLGMTIPEVAEVDQSKTWHQDVTVNNAITVNAVSPATAAAIGTAVAGGAERGTRAGLGALHDGGGTGPAAGGAP